ncbi:hypothetical protein, partial [Anaerotruncus massiliensis (ex Togo et al. 2019)]|uniref:hypothetical protein n=1 Tax=Anaerotruncus massiliensis (ex Togo et al. 2019) TaxID=1673720 RepID=UPI0027B90E46
CGVWCWGLLSGGLGFVYKRMALFFITFVIIEPFGLLAFCLLCGFFGFFFLFIFLIWCFS